MTIRATLTDEFDDSRYRFMPTLDNTHDVKVLLVDSESPVRKRLVGAISELSDVQVETREPREEEVDRTITQFHPDVVLIDIDQSNGRGLAIIRRIRGRRWESGPIIMAIASSASLQYRASCLEAG